MKMMKRFIVLLLLAVLLVITGCTSVPVARVGTAQTSTNIFVSSSEPKITVQMTDTLKRHDTFQYISQIKGGDCAGQSTNTITPFLELHSAHLTRAVFMVRNTLAFGSHLRWMNAGQGTDKDIDGVTMRVFVTPVFFDVGLGKEAALRNIKLGARYSAIFFKKRINEQVMFSIVYVEETPSELGVYWENGRLSAAQMAYVTALEHRALASFKILEYSIW